MFSVKIISCESLTRVQLDFTDFVYSIRTIEFCNFPFSHMEGMNESKNKTS